MRVFLFIIVTCRSNITRRTKNRYIFGNAYNAILLQEAALCFSEPDAGSFFIYDFLVNITKIKNPPVGGDFYRS